MVDQRTSKFRQVRLTNKPINTFVIGDLVLDHAIFVREKQKAHQPVDKEMVCEVARPRLTTAGGAANCARMLAAVSRGKTFLWGIVGRSPWGTFPDVLEISQNLDASGKRVTFRGVHDDAASSNTITRVIVLDDNENETHKMRFDDVGHVQMSGPLEKRAWEAVTDEHNNDNKIGAILINDLDMGTITSALVKEISSFAKDQDIALFIDPKRNIDKYSDVNATAVMPNLDEWRHIIGGSTATDEWRDALLTDHGLREIARRSLFRMPNFVHHLIKCDKNGALLICPNEKNPHEYQVHLFPPHPTGVPSERLKPQLGYGDVMGAIIALEYAAGSNQEHTSARIRNAFLQANPVVAAYRRKPYCRMPNSTDVAQLKETAVGTVAPRLSVKAGVLYLPRSETIELSKFRTEIRTLVSTNETYTSTISRLLTFFKGGWGSDEMKSAILTARGGSGKSALAKGLGYNLKDHKVRVINIEERLPADSASGGSREIIKQLDMINDEDKGQTGKILIMDEAFKKRIKLFQREKGVVLLQHAAAKNMRFLLIDANFWDYRKKLSVSQFLSRCETFVLPEISKRPCDIPLLLATMIFTQAGSRNLGRVKIKRSVLVSVVDWLLSQEPGLCSGRSLSDKARELYEAVGQNGGNSGVLEIQTNHLPNDLRSFAWPQGGLDEFYQFFPA